MGWDAINGDLGDFADLGNDIVDFSVDGLDWMSDGSNWGAAGKTLGYGSLALLTGNPDDALAMWTNSDLYYGDTWDKIDENKEKAKEQKAKIKAAHEDYLKKANEYNANL